MRIVLFLVVEKQAIFRGFPFFWHCKVPVSHVQSSSSICGSELFTRKYARYTFGPVVIGLVEVCSERIIFMGQRRDRLNTRLEKQAKTRRASAPRKAKERIRKAARAAAVASK